MLKISNDFLKFKNEIIDLENKYLTGTFKDLDISANSNILVIYDDELIGYLYFSFVLDEAEIISVCIKDEYRKKGYASQLFDYLFTNYKINYCFLDVKESNYKAINLYKKLGFEQYNSRANYYSDSSTAILMKWSR